jgi:hypothetical protein
MSTVEDSGDISMYVLLEAMLYTVAQSYLPHHEIAQTFDVAGPDQDVQWRRSRLLCGKVTEQDIRRDLTVAKTCSSVNLPLRQSPVQENERLTRFG